MKRVVIRDSDGDGMGYAGRHTVTIGRFSFYGYLGTLDKLARLPPDRLRI